MTTSTLAAAYIREWDDYACIEATAARGLAAEDLRRLMLEYGDRAESIGDEIVSRCQAAVALGSVTA